MFGVGGKVIMGSGFRVPLFNVVSYKDTVLSYSPIAYWRLGESSGTNAVDEVGVTDGTYTNTPTLGTSGLLVDDVNPSATFVSASSQYMAALNQSIFNISLVSVSAIIQVSAFPSAEETFVSFTDGYNTANNDKGLILQTDGKVRFFTYDGNSRGAISADTIPLNVPVHVVGVFAGAFALIYINGVEVGTSAATTSSFTGYTTATICIGGRGGTGNDFNGIIDEVAVFDRGLTPTEVLYIYNAGV